MEPHLEGVRKSQSCKKDLQSLSLPAGRSKWKTGCPVSLNTREQILVGKKSLWSSPWPHVWSWQLAICLGSKLYPLSLPTGLILSLTLHPTNVSSCQNQRNFNIIIHTVVSMTDNTLKQYILHIGISILEGIKSIYLRNESLPVKLQDSAQNGGGIRENWRGRGMENKRHCLILLKSFHIGFNYPRGESGLGE